MLLGLKLGAELGMVLRMTLNKRDQAFQEARRQADLEQCCYKKLEAKEGHPAFENDHLTKKSAGAPTDADCCSNVTT